MAGSTVTRPDQASRPSLKGLLLLVPTAFLIAVLFLTTAWHNDQLRTQAETHGAQLRAQTEAHNAQMTEMTAAHNQLLEKMTEDFNAQIEKRK
jgi:hypothetical protein